jgi:prevent-host-death family protein
MPVLYRTSFTIQISPVLDSHATIGRRRAEEAHMTQRVPVETAMKLTDAKQQLSRVVNEVARGESWIVVEKSGLPVVAIISVDEYRRFKAREETDQARRAELFKNLARFSDAFADVSDEELDRELARVQAKIRTERGDALPT